MLLETVFELLIHRFCFKYELLRESTGRELKQHGLRERFLTTDFFWSVFSGIYGVNFRVQSKYGKIRTRKNSVFGHFSRSDRAVTPYGKKTK